ncbi:DEAD/DEAH box helicase family protein [Sulfobacillus sp. hq2]|uniref:DEAD/DEAH box helicase family protein n=1 Tax=Sulfobacillus sp. hq2 TaxID=2039167 RepID=UPI0013049E20|nr:DEAD/DEAH box helicase family protein [Sulfobacillus sp. hq2]
MTDVTLLTRNLVKVIRSQLKEAQAVYWLVAFAMQSGVELLLRDLKAAEAAGTDIKILVGDYLYVTEPEALAQLLDALPNAELRLWKSQGQSFHAKAYLFEHANAADTMIVGSSNLSQSAMTSGIEWNLLAYDRSTQAVEHFMRLFYADRTVPLNAITLAHYVKDWHQFRQQHPDHLATWTEREALTLMFDPEDMAQSPSPDAQVTPTLLPTPVQAEALAALSDTRQEGYSKALVVLPTGLGKTYLAAFFAQQFRRILFVAHRDEILRQALATFQSVMHQRSFAVYTGKHDDGRESIFASVFTLASEKHRRQFSPTAFDLMVVDEFHHAAAASYQRLLTYFRPQFLLGLTATPDRTDGRDIFSLCDGNVAFQVSLPDAITRQWLSPFWYVGVYDPIDYSALRWRRTHYDPNDLLRAQLSESHVAAVYQAWQAYHQTRTLGFCSSIRHAEFLAEQFAKRGVRSTWVYAGSGLGQRHQVIQELMQGQWDIVFSVDLFNEGVDIPAVDTILLVRPTDSSIVFIQQLGRGLRRALNKTHCVIIDLVGNYRNVEAKLTWLGIKNPAALVTSGLPAIRRQLPPDCRFDLDLQSLNVLERMMRQQTPRKQLVMDAYRHLQEDLGRPPTYLEFHLQSGVPGTAVHQEFGTYIGLKYLLGVLTPDEVQVWDKYQKWLLEVESTLMVKSYKMVLLKAMLARGPLQWAAPVTARDVAAYFHQYLTAEPHRMRIDFSDKTTMPLRTYHPERMANLIQRMPMKQWSQSSAGWVQLTGDTLQIRVGAADARTLTILANWTEQIADYRLHAYFERKSQALT